MTELEDVLRVTFDASTAGLQVPVVRPNFLWQRGRRQRRTQLAAGVGAGTLAVTGGIAAGTVLRTQPDSGSRLSASASPSDPASGVPATPSQVCRVASQPIVRYADARIDAICLPDPAPGFPVRVRDYSGISQGRRMEDGKNVGGETADGLDHAEVSFTVAATPETVVSQDTPADTIPSGPEVDLRVGTPGDFQAAPTDGRINGQPVIATAEVAGRPAYLTRVGPGATTLYVVVKGLVVSAEASDFDGTAQDYQDRRTEIGPDVALPRLVALVEALRIPD